MSESIERLIFAYETLPTLIDRLVFVGGGVTELLITESMDRKTRNTDDLDCIVEVASNLISYHKVEKILRDSGFSHYQGYPPVICRWTKGDFILDVMPTDERILGFSNCWYKDAIESPLKLEIRSGCSVNIIHPVYFIATKTEAFKDRGNLDYRGSRDFEDILTIINGREEIVSEMHLAKENVQIAMRDFWIPKLNTTLVESRIHEHVDGYEDNKRGQMVFERFKEMLS